MEQDVLQQAFDVQYQASRAHLQVSEAVRRDRLLRLQKLLNAHEEELIAAIQADYGIRSARLTQATEIITTHLQLSQALRQLRSWCQHRRVATPLYLQPARARIQYQPLGVVGIIAPWNYPLQLAIGPAIGALAAGNRVMLKPSEMAPALGGLLEQLVGRYFSPDEFAVFNGEPPLALAFASLPFDHLLFTGSTKIGRKVAQAAAQNLTPTTLELGGKSPCVLSADADLDEAAARIAHGKLLNAGQTCIAPDYVLLPRGREKAFAQAYRKAVQRLFPGIPEHPDYASIISATDWSRLTLMLQQAQQLGGEVMEIRASDESPSILAISAHGLRQMPPTLVLGVTPAMRLMQEEIFGPILPLVSYDRPADVPQIIASIPRPMALYWFGRDKTALHDVLEKTVTGAVTVNDTLLHFVHPNLPFGGVGTSGWGAYHGRHGFERFSHARSIFQPSRWPSRDALHPPFGDRFDRIIQLLRRWF